jgi:F-type H+-transporting ATPase subunit b
MFDEKFWLAIAFISFVTLIAKYVWPFLAKSLDETSKKIAQELLAAKTMKEKAEKLLAGAEKFYQESLAHADKLRIDAENEAKKLIESAQNELNAEIKKKTDAAIARVKLEEERLLREIKLQIVNSAINEISQNLNFDAKEQEKIIEKSIANLQRIQ